MCSCVPQGPGTAELQVGTGGPTTWEIVDAIDVSSEETGTKSDGELVHTAEGAGLDGQKGIDAISSKKRTKTKKKAAKGKNV